MAASARRAAAAMASPSAPPPRRASSPLPSAMRAAVSTRHGGPAVIELRDVPVPVPGVGEVVVRVGRCRGSSRTRGVRRGHRRDFRPGGSRRGTATARAASARGQARGGALDVGRSASRAACPCGDRGRTASSIRSHTRGRLSCAGAAYRRLGEQPVATGTNAVGTSTPANGVGELAPVTRPVTTCAGSGSRVNRTGIGSFPSFVRPGPERTKGTCPPAAGRAASKWNRREVKTDVTAS